MSSDVSNSTRYGGRKLALWGAESPSELSSGPARPATISRRSCSSSSFTPASDSSSTSLSLPSATTPLIRPSCWCCATGPRPRTPCEGCPLAPGRLSRPRRPGAPAAEALLVHAAGQAGTVLRWHRELVRRKWASFACRPCRGRPSVSEECGELIRQLAKENSGWGYLRLKGELRKLGLEVSGSTVRRVLRRH